MDRKKLSANILLLITAVIWGGGFVAQRLGMELIGPYMFNGIRFLIGALALVPVILMRGRGRNQTSSWHDALRIGVVAGLFLFCGATFQQLGLVYTTAGKAGFITGLYVIIVPLLGMLWGDRASWNTWIGAGFAVVGLYFLSASRGFQIAPGDGYVLIGAFFWAGHVQLLAHFASRIDAIKLSFVQSLITSLISFVVGFAVETAALAQIQAAFWPLVYGGLISIGLAYTLQVVAQKSARPTPAAIILSLESVFAALLGWLILNETLTPRALGGSILMLAGMILSQMKFRGSRRDLTG